MKKLIVYVNCLKVDISRHDISAYDYAQLMDRFEKPQDWKTYEGTFKGVIIDSPDEDVEDAVAILAEELQSTYSFLGKFSEAIKFDVVYTTIENNRCWCVPCTHNCKDYRVCDYASKKKVKK